MKKHYKVKPIPEDGAVEVEVDSEADVLNVLEQMAIIKKATGKSPIVTFKPSFKMKLRYLLHDIKTLFLDFIELFRRDKK